MSPDLVSEKKKICINSFNMKNANWGNILEDLKYCKEFLKICKDHYVIGKKKYKHNCFKKSPASLINF